MMWWVFGFCSIIGIFALLVSMGATKANREHDRIIREAFKDE